MVRVAFKIIIIFMLPSLLLAKREHPEKWYQERWCRKQGEHGGQTEVVLPGKTPRLNLILACLILARVGGFHMQGI
jgi:hypothetical protein